METQKDPSDIAAAIATYQPTAYEDVSWPRIEGGVQQDESFQQTEFETIDTGVQFVADPMFQDFTEEFAEQAREKEMALDASPSHQEQLQSEFVNGQQDEALSSKVEDSTEETVALDGSNESAEFVADGLEGLSHVEENSTSLDAGADETTEIEPEAPAASSAIDEAALTQALEEAYAKGCADTRAEVELCKQQLEERYTLLWEDMQTQLSESLQISETNAVELAFQIARRMLGNVVENQREYVVGVMKEALQAAGGAEIKCVRVSPQDYEFLSLNQYGERIKIHGDAKLSFASDETIRAGCIIETSSGQIDFDLDKAWARMHGKVFQEPQS